VFFSWLCQSLVNYPFDYDKVAPTAGGWKIEGDEPANKPDERSFLADERVRKKRKIATIT
jgi:hypothetical protein